MRRPLSLLILVLSLSLSGCGPSYLQTTTYVRESLQQKPLLQAESLGGLKPPATQQQDFRVLTQRLVQNRGSITFSPPRTYHYPSKASDVRSRALMDVALVFDLSGDVPLYRIALRPVNRDSRVLERLPGYVSASLYFSGRQDGQLSDRWLIAPMPADRSLQNGVLLTDWVFCEYCLLHTRSSWDDSRREFEPDQVEKLRKDVATLRAAARTGWRGAVVLGFTDDVKTQRKLAGVYADPQLASDADRQRYALGWSEAQRQRQQVFAALGYTDSLVAQAKEANQAYEQFVQEIYQPLSMQAHIRSLACPERYYSRGDPIGGQAQQREVIAKNRRYIRCHREALESYDFSGYQQLWPELLSQEQTLWRQTFGAQRQSMLDAKGQLQYVKKRIEGAYAGIDDAYRRIDSIREKKQQRERERAAMRAAYLGVQNSINRMQAQVRDNQPLVRADGTLSTVGQERSRAILQGQRLLRQNKKGTTTVSERRNSQTQNPPRQSQLQLPSTANTPKPVSQPQPVRNRTLYRGSKGVSSMALLARRPNHACGVPVMAGISKHDPTFNQIACRQVQTLSFYVTNSAVCPWGKPITFTRKPLAEVVEYSNLTDQEYQRLLERHGKAGPVDGWPEVWSPSLLVVQQATQSALLAHQDKLMASGDQRTPFFESQSDAAEYAKRQKCQAEFVSGR